MYPPIDDIAKSCYIWQQKDFSDNEIYVDRRNLEKLLPNLSTQINMKIVSPCFHSVRKIHKDQQM